ncbi:unnamed protein product, partial [Symbiodinium microadriaticum]
MPQQAREGLSSLPEKDLEADSRTRVEEQIVADPPGVLAAPEAQLLVGTVSHKTLGISKLSRVKLSLRATVAAAQNRRTIPELRAGVFELQPPELLHTFLPCFCNGMAYLSAQSKAYLHPPTAAGSPYVSAVKSVRIQASDERESDETTSNEEEAGDPTGEQEEASPKPYDETWRWGIWQSRDAKRAATGYTDQLISHMPESFRFQREVLDGRNIALGAKLLLALNAASILLAYVLIWLLLLMFRNPADCDTDCQVNLHNCAVGDLLIEVNGGFGRVVADIVYLVIVIPTVIYCFMWEVSEQDRHMRRRIYLVMLIIVYVRLWLMFMYPVGVHCSRAKRALTCGGLRHSHEDLIPECRNFGFFLLNKDMGLVMVSPVVIPECAKMRPVLWSLTGVFYLVAMLAVHALVKTPEQRYHAYFDTLIGSDPSDGRKLH